MHAWLYNIAIAVSRSAVQMAAGALDDVLFAVYICRGVKWWRWPTCNAGARVVEASRSDMTTQWHTLGKCSLLLRTLFDVIGPGPFFIKNMERAQKAKQSNRLVVGHGEREREITVLTDPKRGFFSFL
jgi:hypothetical protein